MGMKTVCEVYINGQNVSSTFFPLLIDIEITDKAGTASDSCSLKLDDTGGNILFPEDGASIEVLLGDESGVDLAFVGTVDEVKSSGARSGGMVMSVTARGVDTKGKAKQPQRKHFDDKNVKDVVTEAGKEAGITSVEVAPSLASITRPYWAMQGESFLHFGERIAREIGGTFKVVGQKAIIADRNGGTSASGAALAQVSATRGVNLISWDLSPALGRQRYKTTKVRHYDRKTATWNEETAEIGDDGAEAEHTARHAAADQTEAKQGADGSAKTAQRLKGGGSITINGTTDAQPEGSVVLSGARPGIDGTYRIDAVIHNFSRGSGWTTRLDVKQPQGDAGSDSRGS